jgi:putative membrane protein
MVMRAAKLFGPGAFEAIEAAVREAERRTSGEIVPMVVPRSDGYPGVRAVTAAILAFAAGVVLLASPLDPRVWLPPTELAAFAAGYWLAGRPPLLRLLLTDSAREAAVERAARLAFLEGGLVETRDRTGILIYVSLLERRVEIVADRGIHERVEAGTWDEVVRIVLDGVREGRAGDGLARAVRRCGDILAERFPRRPDDTDELANRPRP